MPIYITDGNVAHSGSINTSMAPFAASLDGVASPGGADIDGFLQRAINQFSVRFQDRGDYPRLGISAIGGWSQNSFDNFRPGGFIGRIERIAAHDVAILGVNRNWTYNGSTGPSQNRSTICGYIKVFNPSAILYTYTFGGTDIRDTSVVDPWPDARTKWDDEQWYLYDGAGRTFDIDVVRGSGTFDDYQAIADSAITGVDSSGVGPAEWTARAEHAKNTDSGDWVTGGIGLRSEYGFDGVYQDIMRYVPRESGDWNLDGSNEDRESAEVLAIKFNGDQQYHAEWDVLEPNSFLHAGNYTANAGVSGGQTGLDEYNQAISSGYQNLVNGAFLEATIGRGSSIETWGGWDALMRYYKRAMTLVSAMTPGHVFFDNWEVDGHDEDDPNIWSATHSIYDWGRYGLCTCLMDNGYYGYPTSGGFVDANILDEYSFNLGGAIDAPKYDGNDPTTSLSGSGYLPDQLGVYWREFDNGLAVVNPKGNGQQTITLPRPPIGIHYERLNAADYDNQDPGVNDGATYITTQTLPERHGIIIAKVGTPPSWGVTQGETNNLPIIPGLRGPGYDTFAGSGRHLVTPATTVLYVDSLATDDSNTDSTHGSLKWCLHQTFPRVIVPAISGVISFAADSIIEVSDPYFTYAGQCAPGDGLHVHRCSLQVATKQGLVWHWSGFMQDSTSQGTGDNIQLGTNNSTEDQTGLVVANSTGMYGMDQTMSSFNSSNSYVSEFTFWQCLIGSAPDGGISGGYSFLLDMTNGPGISADPMPKGALLRTFMGNCNRRNPLINGGLFESSNNLVYGANWNAELLADDGTTFAAATEINFRSNGFVLGNGTDFEAFHMIDHANWDLGGYYYSSNTVQDSTYTEPEWNNSTPTNWPPGDVAPQATLSANAAPEGWVPLTLTDSDAGLLELTDLMDQHVGARPSNRLAVHQQEIDWCINYLNSTTPIGSQITAALPPPSVSSVTINHETTGSHGVDPIPTGGAQDVVQESGYTALEEWLHDHHSFFMPVGWDV